MVSEGSERDQKGWMNGVQCHVVMSNMMANGTERLESLVEPWLWQEFGRLWQCLHYSGRV